MHGRRLSSSYGRTFVAVTLEGTIIHKSGLITGGRSSHGDNKKWEEKDIQGMLIVTAPLSTLTNSSLKVSTAFAISSSPTLETSTSPSHVLTLTRISSPRSPDLNRHSLWRKMIWLVSQSRIHI